MQHKHTTERILVDSLKGEMRRQSLVLFNLGWESAHCKTVFSVLCMSVTVAKVPSVLMWGSEGCKYVLVSRWIHKCRMWIVWIMRISVFPSPACSPLSPACWGRGVSSKEEGSTMAMTVVVGAVTDSPSALVPGSLEGFTSSRVVLYCTLEGIKG